MSANTLNDLTRQVTAFRTWPEFAEAMHGGYVPTLMTTRGPGSKKFNAAVAELAYRLEELGFRVFRGLK